MKRNNVILLISIIIIFIFSSCCDKNCNGNFSLDESTCQCECPFSNFCQGDCATTKLDCGNFGVWNDITCKCICDEFWSGPNCDVLEITGDTDYITYEISYIQDGVIIEPYSTVIVQGVSGTITSDLSLSQNPGFHANHINTNEGIIIQFTGESEIVEDTVYTYFQDTGVVCNFSTPGNSSPSFTPIDGSFNVIENGDEFIGTFEFTMKGIVQPHVDTLMIQNGMVKISY